MSTSSDFPSVLSDSNAGAYVSSANSPPKTNTPNWTELQADLVATARILIVDEQQTSIDLIQGYLEKEGYRRFFRATEGAKALDTIQRVKPDVVLMDLIMPDLGGLEILAAMRADEQTLPIPVIILTACTDAETKLEVLRLGPSDYLHKPVNARELQLRLRNVLTVKSFQDQLANYSRELEEQVRIQTLEVLESRQRIVHCLARAAEFRDDDTGHHVIRVGKYAAVIAKNLGLAPQQVELIEQAAQLHDIGKIGVPDAILLKEGKLDPEEFNVVKRHCSFGSSIINPRSAHENNIYQGHAELGAELLKIGGFPVMELAGIIAQTHHERWDGSGYPLGLAGEDIPLEGRITAIADVYDALSTKRPYKPAFSREKCFRIMEEGRGTHFDPRLLDAFFSCSDEIVAVQIRFADVERM